MIYKPEISSTNSLDYYTAEVLSYNDYYPFSAPMHERSGTNGGGEYRYGFQNQEQDSELWEGAVSFKYRVEDVRLGRFFSVDPLIKDYPWFSPYHLAGNIPIRFIDIEGAEPASSGSYDGEVRVAKVSNCEDDIKDNIYYWVWIQDSKPENASDGDWVVISVRPIEIVAFMNSEPTYVPSPLWGTMAEQNYRDAREQSDVVPNPEIASTGGASGVNGGRYGCTRFDAKKNCGGKNGRKMHDGTDVFSEPGKPIFAIFGGTVEKVMGQYAPGSKADNGYGNYIIVSTMLPNGMKLTLKYAHLDGVGVKVGDHVQSGENIGTSGATGNAWNVPFKHIHVRAQLDGESVDPEGFMPSVFNSQGKSTQQQEE